MSSDDSRHDEANYQAALGTVRHAILQFDGCSDAEREALAGHLDQLQAMEQKLASGCVEIVVFGEISTGKSALINALVGQRATGVHVQGGWTKDVWHVAWEGSGYRVAGLEASEVVLVDTPGLNEVDGASRAQMARDAASRADMILFVTDSDLNDTEYAALVELAAGHKPILLVVNKMDLYPPAQRAELRKMLTGPRYAKLVAPRNVIMTAADPQEVEYVIESADRSVRREWRKPCPDVEQLRATILTVLDQEGKALIALNAAMYAADKSDRVAAIRVRMREERAATTIWSYTVTKSVAVALNPVPAADVLAGSAIDVTMVATLAKVYGIRLSTSNARELVHAIFQAAGWVMLGEAVTHVAATLFKGLTMGYGTVLTALPQGGAAGYGSYIVGQAARYYFQQGASWGSEAPKTVVTRILEQTDRESILRQLKAEIRKKIDLNPYARGSDA